MTAIAVSTFCSTNQHINIFVDVGKNDAPLLLDSSGLQDLSAHLSKVYNHT